MCETALACMFAKYRDGVVLRPESSCHNPFALLKGV